MIMLQWFDFLVGLMANMWKTLSDFEIFEYSNGISIIKVSFTAVVMSFSLMTIIWFRFFRSN